VIERFYLKNYLSFDSVELNFQDGLVVFTGPSGSGKSLFMNSFLSLFGLSEAKAHITEAIIKNGAISNEEFDITNDDEIVIKQIKKDKVRYFINYQTIAKKKLVGFTSEFIKYLHLKDTSDFQSSNILYFIDTLISKTDDNYKSLLSNYKELYKEYMSISKELHKLIEDELKVEDIKEFLSFEIKKIESISPQVDEYDELFELKKKIAKREKLEEKIKEASFIFEYSSSVSMLLEEMEIQSSFFDDAMSELENIFESFKDSFDELDGIDIEETLSRLEQLSRLIKKYGSIEQTLEYLETKQQELNKYENITFEKKSLEKKLSHIDNQLQELCKQITQKRIEVLPTLEAKVNHYLKLLYLDNLAFKIDSKKRDIMGVDEVVITLKNIALDNISSGEFNRLRLALLTAYSEFDLESGGVLFLDEIDANLSGKESESIAKVLQQLSVSYQIFAISHQPQLTSSAHQHFLVEKSGKNSTIKELDDDGRIKEIARIISGHNITDEAIEYAKRLIKR
jgi:DNA repair protein RecN (Recombination protein N)